MIFVSIRADARPDKRDDFLSGVVRYSRQVRDEPGNLDFRCFESVEEPNRFAILASYRDQAAGEAHVGSEHAQWFFGWLPAVVSRVPTIVFQDIGDITWTEMGEVLDRMS